MKKSLFVHFRSKHKSVEERIVAGKALRKKLPPIEQGDYKPSGKRADPIAILEEQAKTRLQDLVPIRCARMLTSPFAFLRGGAAIMAADLASGTKTTGIKVQACGDMHVANFGVFASAERNLVFGINDFDETFPGPWEWDLKRLVASIVSSGRFLGADENLCREAVMASVKSYRENIKKFAVRGNLELWYSTISEQDILNSVSASARKGAEKIIEKARTRTHMQVLEKLTDIIDKKNRLRDNAPFIVHVTHSQTGRPIEDVISLVSLWCSICRSD